MARWQRELAEKMKDPDERRRMQEQAEKMDPNNTITGDDLQKMLDKNSARWPRTASARRPSACSRSCAR